MHLVVMLILSESLPVERVALGEGLVSAELLAVAFLDLSLGVNEAFDVSLRGA